MGFHPNQAEKLSLRITPVYTWMRNLGFQKRNFEANQVIGLGDRSADEVGVSFDGKWNRDNGDLRKCSVYPAKRLKNKTGVGRMSEVENASEVYMCF